MCFLFFKEFSAGGLRRGEKLVNRLRFRFRRANLTDFRLDFYDLQTRVGLLAEKNKNDRGRMIANRQGKKGVIFACENDEGLLKRNTTGFLLNSSLEKMRAHTFPLVDGDRLYLRLFYR